MKYSKVVCQPWKNFHFLVFLGRCGNDVSKHLYLFIPTIATYNNKLCMTLKDQKEGQIHILKVS